MASDTHAWPTDGEHLYGKWQTYSRSEQYRQCVHPKCHHFETRKAAKA